MATPRLRSGKTVHGLWRKKSPPGCPLRLAGVTRHRILSLRHPRDREILRLAVPAFGALVAEPLFLLADSAIVGRLGTAPLGGLGVASTALTTLVYLCVFLAYATTAAVARRLGAGDLRGAIQQGIDGMWLALAIGVVLLVAGIPLTPWVVDALGASTTVAPYAETYLRISLLGIPAMLMVLAGTGVLRGLQDTRTPLVVAVAGSTVNVALSAWFVLGLGWGVAGSAWGTVIVQVGSALAYVAVVARGARRHRASARPHRAGVRRAATAGAALVVRTVAMRVVLIVAAAVAARLGDAEIAAYQVAFLVWSLLALAHDSIAIAAQAIVGKYLGAGDTGGTRSTTRRMTVWGAVAGVAFALAVLAVRPVLPLAFTDDPAVHALLLTALLIVAALQPLAGVVFVLDGVLIGAGDLRYLAVASIVATVSFLPAAAAVLLTGAGLAGVWGAIGVWMLARLVTLGARERGTRWMVTGAVRTG